jgi:hypothetical protein
LGLLAYGTVAAFQDSGKWTPVILLAVSTVSSLLYLAVTLGRAMGKA